MDPTTQSFAHAVSNATSAAPLWKKWLISPIGMSIATVIMTIIVLTILNPPMVQTKDSNDIKRSATDSRRIINWGIAAGLVVFFGPYAYNALNKAADSPTEVEMI